MTHRWDRSQLSQIKTNIIHTMCGLLKRQGNQATIYTIYTIMVPYSKGSGAPGRSQHYQIKASRLHTYFMVLTSWKTGIPGQIDHFAAMQCGSSQEGPSNVVVDYEIEYRPFVVGSNGAASTSMVLGYHCTLCLMSKSVAG